MVIYNVWLSSIRKKRQSYFARKEKSVGAIAEELNVSKSSVSTWCRDIKLTITQKRFLKKNSSDAGNKGRMIGAEMNRQKRLDSIGLYESQGRKEIGNLSKRDLTMLATALFWAEGAKTGSRFIFINSDPNMILLIFRYLTQVLKVDPSRISATVQINRIHEKRIDTVLNFWATILKLPRERLGTPYYIDAIPKKNYDNYDSYNGILRLRVSNGSGLQYKLLGYISALK